MEKTSLSITGLGENWKQLINHFSHFSCTTVKHFFVFQAVKREDLMLQKYLPWFIELLFIYILLKLNNCTVRYLFKANTSKAWNCFMKCKWNNNNMDRREKTDSLQMNENTVITNTKVMQKRVTDAAIQICFHTESAGMLSLCDLLTLYCMTSHLTRFNWSHLW